MFTEYFFKLKDAESPSPEVEILCVPRKLFPFTQSQSSVLKLCLPYLGENIGNLIFLPWKTN